MEEKRYQICSRCVMDTTDPDVIFDADGICNHCHARDKIIRKMPTGVEAALKLEQMVDRIKQDGKGREYDCIVGVSGGVDSSYVAYKVKELGLRALAVHLDNGWDSELAVKNIENLLNILGIELYTYVIDWEEFRDLQLSFLKASTPDSEIPSDHAIFASVIKLSWEKEIPHIIWGFNMATETHLPPAWSYGHMDWKYIKSVHQQFGSIPLKTYPHLNFWQYRKYRMQSSRYSHSLLDLIDYNKNNAMQILQNKLGWRYYGGKHYESIYTRFYQGYILPRKFGFDKRRTHFSSLISNEEITRSEALEELKQDTYPMEMQMEDREYVIKKLGITEEEFESIMNNRPALFSDYPSYTKMYNQSWYLLGRKIYKMLRKR